MVASSVRTERFRLAAGIDLATPDGAARLVVDDMLDRLVGLADRAERIRRRPQRLWLDEAASLLEQNDGERSIGLSELATRIGVDRSHLARAFRRRFGLSPGSYVRRARLARAANLLREGNRPIGWIAHECGFYDHAHFTNLFRRPNACTPAAYRSRR